ncbi:MAG: outer membrane protein transport protein, partial [Candidatus Aminicenantaceae bacterium]
IDTLETNYLDPFWNTMMEASGDDKRPMNWEDALQIRFGAEYRIKNFAFRGGYYIDPSPAPAQTMNVLLPNYDFNVITVGFGYALNGIQFDFGLEYLMGKERSVPFTVAAIATPPGFEIQMPSGYETAMPGTYTMKIIVPTLSVSYRF